jgi:uncharacterized membrane protein (UPF0127 family)
MSKKFQIFFLLLLFSAVVFYISYKTYLWPFFVRDRQLVTLQLKSHLFAPVKKEVTVEVVKNVESLSRGLSGRPELLSQNGQQIDGLLFIFASEQQQFFWMKEMFFDIDICWLRDRRLHSCHIAVAPEDPNELSTNLPIYPSPVEVDLVLETEPGFFSKQDFGGQFFAK